MWMLLQAMDVSMTDTVASDDSDMMSSTCDSDKTNSQSSDMTLG